jgi:hypothetical protein
MARSTVGVENLFTVGNIGSKSWRNGDTEGNSTGSSGLCCWEGDVERKSKVRHHALYTDDWFAHESTMLSLQDSTAVGVNHLFHKK